MQVVAYGAVSALCITLITFLIRVRRILDVVETNVNEISKRAIPVLDNLETITDKIRSITETVADQIDGVKQTVGSLKEIGDSIIAFEHRVQEQIEEPVMQTVEAIASILRSIQEFIERLPFVSRLRA